MSTLAAQTNQNNNGGNVVQFLRKGTMVMIDLNQSYFLEDIFQNIFKLACCEYLNHSFS